MEFWANRGVRVQVMFIWLNGMTLKCSYTFRAGGWGHLAPIFIKCQTISVQLHKTPGSVELLRVLLFDANAIINVYMLTTSYLSNILSRNGGG